MFVRPPPLDSLSRSHSQMVCPYRVAVSLVTVVLGSIMLYLQFKKEEVRPLPSRATVTFAFLPLE